tara:strand:+ start:352 stop:510 length:159 start_codon:yes stop_codon:yes gene_type:complete
MDLPPTLTPEELIQLLQEELMMRKRDVLAAEERAQSNIIYLSFGGNNTSPKK